MIIVWINIVSMPLIHSLSINASNTQSSLCSTNDVDPSTPISYEPGGWCVPALVVKIRNGRGEGQSWGWNTRRSHSRRRFCLNFDFNHLRYFSETQHLCFAAIKKNKNDPKCCFLTRCKKGIICNFKFLIKNPSLKPMKMSETTLISNKNQRLSAPLMNPLWQNIHVYLLRPRNMLNPELTES